MAGRARPRRGPGPRRLGERVQRLAGRRGDPGRYHCLFGRDSLITALAVLPARPDVAAATLRALAAIQGTREDVTWDEEPGKIVHEVRAGHLRRAPGLPGARGARRRAALLRLGRRDAVFLHVLAATGDAALAAELEPAWRAAGEWLLGALERGGGLLRWHRARAGRPRPAGLARHRRPRRLAVAGQRDPARGRLGRPSRRWPTPTRRRRRSPGCARWRGCRGDPAHADGASTRWPRASARRWDPETMALDAHDRPVRGAGSQLGWLLWAGRRSPAPPSASPQPDVLTDFGLRTLSRPPPAASTRSPTTAARSGRSTRGWAGAGCAPPGTRTDGRARPRRRARGRRADRPLPRALRGDRRRPRGGDARRTSCRRGPSARCGRCATSGTGARMWWRDGVLYQIYPRSFADSDGDGIGDLRGITGAPGPPRVARRRRPLAEPDVPLAQRRLGLRRRRLPRRAPRARDARGPRRAVARAGERGIRVLLDLVPNHTSDQHPWFVDALAAATPHRDFYVWARPGRDGGPPNNWTSNFGGPAWTRDERQRPVLPAQLPARRSPTSTGGTRTCATRSTTSCASGSTAASRASASTSRHGIVKDRELRDNPPATDGRPSEHDRWLGQRQVYSMNRAGGARRLPPLARGRRRGATTAVLVGETYVLDLEQLMPLLRRRTSTSCTWRSTSSSCTRDFEAAQLRADRRRDRGAAARARVAGLDARQPRHRRASRRAGRAATRRSRAARSCCC